MGVTCINIIDLQIFSSTHSPKSNQMKTRLVFMVLLIACLSCGKNNKNASDIEILKNLELTRLKSLVDANIEVAKPLHADDFQLITPDGSEYDKQQYLGEIESGMLDYKIWDADTIRVRMYHNVAVLRYKDKDFKVFIDGELAKSEILKHTNLYEKRNGQWQIVWSHASGGTEPETNLSQSTNAIQAQTTNVKLNQVELMKQCIGYWKSEIDKDTTLFFDFNSYGTGFESYVKFVTKGKIVKECKQLYGYVKKDDKYVIAEIYKGDDMILRVTWFTSKNKYVCIPYSDISNPEKATIKFEGEFKSPDKWVETYMVNNKPIVTDTYTRVK
jgi:GH24 family phage-related lysozyme (muramidase)